MQLVWLIIGHQGYQGWTYQDYFHWVKMRVCMLCKAYVWIVQKSENRKSVHRVQSNISSLHLLWKSAISRSSAVPLISTPVTEIKYSLKISTPPVLIFQEICTPPEKKVLPRRALRVGNKRNNLSPWRLKLPLSNILYQNLHKKVFNDLIFRPDLLSVLYPFRGIPFMEQGNSLYAWRNTNVCNFERFVIFCVSLLLAASSGLSTAQDNNNNLFESVIAFQILFIYLFRIFCYKIKP